MIEITEEEISERIKYLTILYERSIVALDIYRQSADSIHASVIKAQEHTVKTNKIQLEKFLKEHSNEH